MLILIALLFFIGTPTPVPEDYNIIVVYDFTEEDDLEKWYVVNDTIMGGMSNGTFQNTEDESALFAGEVSLDNNGGFSSARVDFRPTDLRNFEGVALLVRGDGQTYGFNLRDTNSRIQYRYKFETATLDWQAVFIPFSDFVPTQRNITLENAPPLDLSRVRTFGFIITDEQEGTFQLEISQVGVYKDGTIRFRT